MGQDTQPTVAALPGAEVTIQSHWQAVNHGFEQLQARIGNTQLVLKRPRLDRGSGLELPNPDSDTREELDHAHHKLSHELLIEVGLCEQACTVISQQPSLPKAVAMLVEMQLQADALRYLTAYMPALTRIRWCHGLLEQAHLTTSDPCVGDVRAWLAQPSEALRARLAQSVNWGRKNDPWTWLLASISWTGGSLSGNSSIPVPPTDVMVVTGVITAINLASATCGQPFQALAIETALRAKQDER